MRNWINITEALPKKGVRVRCKLSKDIGLNTTERNLYRMKHNGNWNDYSDLVTHWMPLQEDTRTIPILDTLNQPAQ